MKTYVSVSQSGVMRLPKDVLQSLGIAGKKVRLIIQKKEDKPEITLTKDKGIVELAGMLSDAVPKNMKSLTINEIDSVLEEALVSDLKKEYGAP